MKSLRVRFIIWGCLFGVMVLLFILALIKSKTWPESYSAIIMSLSLLPGALSLVCWIRTYRSLSLAKLILDNQILHVSTVDFDGVAMPRLEVVVSVFGILMEDKVIPFNQDGIRLFSLIIAHNSMDIIYGTDVSSHEINLSFQNISEDLLKGIVDKFSFETGVVPVFRE